VVRLMKGILECREVAQAIRCPEFEDASLTLSRLAYIEHLLSALAPGLCRRMSEGERQRWMQMMNGPAPVKTLQVNATPKRPSVSPCRGRSEDDCACYRRA
jgi:hypothetical protein